MGCRSIHSLKAIPAGGGRARGGGVANFEMQSRFGYGGRRAVVGLGDYRHRRRRMRHPGRGRSRGPTSGPCGEGPTHAPFASVARWRGTWPRTLRWRLTTWSGDRDRLAETRPGRTTIRLAKSHMGGPRKCD